MDSTDAKTAFANSAKITKLVEDAIKELDLETVTSTSSSTSTTTAPTTTTTTTSTSTSPSTSKVITGTSGDDYLELTVWDFIASGNGGNDTFIVSAQGEIIDLSTGDIIIPNSAHINAKNVKNFIATSESKLSGSSATNFYSDISGSEIDMSLATFMSDGPQGVTFIVGNGVDLLTGTAEGDQFMVMQSSAANSDSLDGKGGEWDRLTLMGNSHSFLNDSNIKNIERISFNSSIGDNSNLDLSSQTENFIEIGGGAGNDIIKSGSGNDSISTGLGNDMIYSGAGSDTLTGGTGSDTFVFLKSDGTSGADTITDFTAQAGDKIDLSSFGISTKSKALDTMTDDGSGNTQVTIDGDLIVTLNGISKSVLSGYDFIA